MRHFLSLLRVGLLNISAVMVVFLFTAQSANATLGPYSERNLFGDMQTNGRSLNNPIVGNIFGDSVHTGTTEGVESKVTGKVIVPTSTGPIEVPASVTAKIPRAAVAKAVGNFVGRALPIVGTAVAVAELVIELKNLNKGYGDCPTDKQGIVCKQKTGPVTDYYWIAAAGTACRAISDHCSLDAAASGTAAAYTGDQTGSVVSTSPDGTTKINVCNIAVTPASCGVRTFYLSGYPVTTTKTTYDPATAGDVEGDMTTGMGASPSLGGRAYDSMSKAVGNSLPLFSDTTLNPVTAGTPLVFEAGPVVGPLVNTKTETVSNADGSASTKKTSDQTTVTPQTTGTTVGDSRTTFPSVTTTVVTTTNNVTNVTTTDTQTTNNVDKASPQTTPAPDTGPKECGTPGKPKCQIDETGTPDATGVDKDSDLAKIGQKNTDFTNSVAQITPDSVGLFDWFPHIPTAQCQDPQVQNPVTHALVSMEWPCKTVNIFTTFISAVMCFFCLIGSVRNVQDALKA